MNRNTRTRILLLLPSLHGGGAERVAIHLQRHLNSDNFNTRVGLLKEGGHYIHELEPSALLRSQIGDGLFDFDGPNSLGYQPIKAAQAAMLGPKRIRDLIAGFGPDIIMSFLKGMNLLTWRALNNLHGASRPVWIAREGNNALRVIAEEAPNVAARKTVEILTRRAYRACDILLGVSERQIADLRTQLSLARDRCHFIHNGVDITRIKALSEKQAVNLPQRPFIVTAGRLEPQKGHDVLLRAYATGSARFKADLVILGSGTRLDELRSMAAQLGIEGYVHFIGFQKNPWIWFRKAKLFAFPSLWEGFGNVVVEALACGTPVVSSDCDYGPGELVENDKQGLLVPPGDVSALQCALDKLLDDENRLQMMANAALMRAEAFDVTKMCTAYEQLFERLQLQRHRVASAATDL